MKTIVMLGKRRSRESPLVHWPGAELWGVSGSQQRYSKKYGFVTDWTSWHDYHHVERRSYHKGIKATRPDTYRWYQSLPGPESPQYRPLYLLDRDPSIPASVALPWREILERWKIPEEGDQAMITCQMDLMMAWALMQGVEHLVLHGHGVRQDPLHMVQHRGILYWIAVARTMGVKVTVVKPSWYSAPDKPYGIAAGSWMPA